jgi:predicted GTPase
MMATWFEKIGALPQTFQGWLSGSNSVNMLVTGKTGVGKSSLINGIVGKEVAKKGDSLDRGTVEVQAFAFKYHDVDITIWDSPGLQDGLDKEEEYIRDMQRKGCANSDLMLYCVKMSDTRFRKEDHDAVRKLTVGLGKDIWKNAIFVMTFANDVRARRERGQKLTPDEERKRNFRQRIEEWKAKLVGAVIEAGVDAKIAASIPIVPAGYDQEQELPDRDNWLSPLWYASILRMKEHSQSALLKTNLHRIKLPDQITPDDFNKPLHEQPIVYMPVHVKYGVPFTGIGAILGSVAGPMGAAAGGVVGAGLGGVMDGFMAAYFTSSAGETTEPETDSKNGERFLFGHLCVLNFL